jgi:hypothetical protein
MRTLAMVAAKKTSSKKLKAGKKRRINKWLVIASVAVIAIIGVVVVRYSSASRGECIPGSDYTFHCYGTSLKGGQPVNKQDGTHYRMITPSNPMVTITVPAKLTKDTVKVCTGYSYNTGSRITITAVINGTTYSRPQDLSSPASNKATGGSTCVSVPKQSGNNGISIRITSSKPISVGSVSGWRN